VRRKHQFAVRKRRNREKIIPATHRGIAAKAEHRRLVLHSDRLENQPIDVFDILPLNELPKRLSDDMGTIQMLSGILAGKL